MFHFNDCNDSFLLIFLYSIIIMAQSLTTVSFIYSMHQSLSTTYISRQTKTGRLHHLQFLIKQLRDRLLWDESWIRCMLLKLNNSFSYFWFGLNFWCPATVVPKSLIIPCCSQFAKTCARSAPNTCTATGNFWQSACHIWAKHLLFYWPGQTHSFGAN